MSDMQIGTMIDALPLAQMPRARRSEIAPPVAHPDQARAMRRMWCSVLYEQLRLAIALNRDQTKYNHADSLRALEWIGGRDFRDCCALAGVDADYIERGFRARIAIGRPLNDCVGVNQWVKS